MGLAREQVGEEREKVIACARALIARDGLAKFTVRALSAETGVARATLHRRFGGKQALIAAILADDVSALSDIAESASQGESLKVVNGPVTLSSVEAVSPVPDAWLERRLRVFERALGALEARQNKFERNLASLARLDETLSQFAEHIAKAEARSEEAATVATATAAAATAARNAPRPFERVRLAPLVDARAAEPELPFQEPVSIQQVAAEPERNNFIAEARRRTTQTAAEVAAASAIPRPEPGLLRRRIINLLAFVVLIASIGVMIAHSTPSVILSVHASPAAGTAHRRVASSAGAKLIALADSGEAVAQYTLGTHYLASDPQAGLRWLAAAAAQGNRKAMHNLGIAYALGKGTPPDPQAAARWFARAASLGYVDSAFDLAVLYERGEGVPQDIASACKWYLIAAGEGDAQSAPLANALGLEMRPQDFAAARAAAQAFVPVLPDARANFTALPPGI